ncbi:MAG: hypothetical protein WA239_17740 [Candidatus Sulfotelmatobacter sp.]
MKPQALAVCLAVIFCIAPMESQRSLPETPGKLEIAKYPLVLDPPTGPQAQKLDSAKLHQEAAELAQLAQTVPADIDQIAQGRLPKDLADKLKHIEKLSKKLRGELTP